MEQFIDLRALAMESRRLSRHIYAIPAFSLLINEKILVKDLTITDAMKSPQAQKLIDMCNIVTRRFCKNASNDVRLLINLAKLSASLIGQHFMLVSILSIFEAKVDEDTLFGVFATFPEFFKAFVMSRTYSNPLSLCSSMRASEQVVPMQIPNLSFFKNSGCSRSLLRYMIQLPIELSFQSIRECIQSDNLFPVFADFVYRTPSFFILADHIVTDTDELASVFGRLVEKSAPQFIDSFMKSIEDVNDKVLNMFCKFVDDETILRFLSERDDMLHSVLYFFVLCKKFEILEKLDRVEDLFAVLEEVFRQKKDFYFELLDTCSFDPLVRAVEPHVFAKIMDQKGSKLAIIGKLIRHDIFISDMIAMYPEVVKQWLDKGMYVARIRDFFKNRQELVSVDEVFNQESILYHYSMADENNWLSIFVERPDDLIIVARQRLMSVLMTGEEFLESPFIDAVINTGRFREIVHPIFHENTDNWKSSPELNNVITKIPAFLFMALECFSDDPTYIENILNEFSYNTLKVEQLKELLAYFIGNSSLIRRFSFSVQIRLFDCLMKILRTTTDRDFILLSLDFLIEFKGLDIFTLIDDHMRDLVFKRIFTPLIEMKDPPMQKISTLMSIISVTQVLDNDPDLAPGSPTMIVQPQELPTETVESMVRTICTGLNMEFAKPEDIQASLDLVQLAILNTELGYDAEILEMFAHLLHSLAGSDFHIMPEFLSALCKRVAAFQDGHHPELQGQLYNILSCLRAMPKSFIDCIAAIVK